MVKWNKGSFGSYTTIKLAWKLLSFNESVTT